jgi:hypothetical protein
MPDTIFSAAPLRWPVGPDTTSVFCLFVILPTLLA